MPKDETFIDCLTSATLRDGVVRLEFSEFREKQPVAEGAEAPPELVAKCRLLIPVPGFARSLQVMQEVMKRIDEKQRMEGGTKKQPAVVIADPFPGKNTRKQ